MEIELFKLERLFAEHEFRARHLLSASDCEMLSLSDLVELAEPESRQLWQDLSLGYTESQGHPLLRQEVASAYMKAVPDDVLIAAPEELIFIAMNCILCPGDHVVVVSPAYQSLYSIAAALQCRVTRWELELLGDSWRLDLDSLRKSITPHTRLVIINFPHNPTGALISHDELAAIVELATKHGLYLFSDEMYRLLEPYSEARLPAVTDLCERGISLSGLSKAFGLPGLRIGWLVTRDAGLLRRCIHLHDYTTICSSAPSEVLGIIALRAQEAILQRNLRIIHSNLEVAEAFFSGFGDLFHWIAPRAGSVAFPGLRGEMQSSSFCRDLLEQASVLAVPGDVFDHAGNHFRVGLGRAGFTQALRRVETFLCSPAAS